MLWTMPSGLYVLGSTDKQWVLAGTETGFPIDLGHDDLVAGLCSPRLVYPGIAAWLRVRMRRARHASERETGT